MTLPLTSQKSLVLGSLNLKRFPDSAGMVFQATSGLPGYQYFRSWNLRGRGLIPPHKLCSIPCFQLSTERLNLSHIKGVRGGFYAITPFEIQIDGRTRSDFGMHFDAGVVGSAGCIVLRITNQWRTLEDELGTLRKQGHASLRLVVDYKVSPF